MDVLVNIRPAVHHIGTGAYSLRMRTAVPFARTLCIFIALLGMSVTLSEAIATPTHLVVSVVVVHRPARSSECSCI
jgi:hypothetical protein